MRIAPLRGGDGLDHDKPVFRNIEAEPSGGTADHGVLTQARADRAGVNHRIAAIKGRSHVARVELDLHRPSGIVFADLKGDRRSDIRQCLNRNTIASRREGFGQIEPRIKADGVVILGDPVAIGIEKSDQRVGVFVFGGDRQSAAFG